MNEIVKYDNSMNSLKFKNFTQRDFNFFFAICSKVRDKHTDQVSIDFENLRELSGYEQTSKEQFTSDLKRMFDKLQKITYSYEDEESYTLFTLFTKFKILKTRDEVQIRVSEEFEFLLNDLGKHFTRYELETFVNLTSKHSKTLYRLLKQWRTQGTTQEYKVEELKKQFDCEKWENRDFLNKAIKPAVKELMERKLFNDLVCVPVKARKRGAPVIAYRFTFKAEKALTEQQKQAIEHKAKGTYQKSRKKNKSYKSDRPLDPDIEYELLKASGMTADSEEEQVPGQMDISDYGI